MKKGKNKKRVKHRIKVIPMLIFLLIIGIISIVIFFIMNFKIQNIFIHNNANLSDEYIISYAKLDDYPGFLSTLPFLESKLKKSPFIKDAKVKGKFFGVVDITIEENKILFYKDYDNKYVMESLEEIDELPFTYSSTRVINYIPDGIYGNFLSRYKRLNIEVISKISEIKYDPTEYDEERFLLYMVDGNYVYVTTTKLENLNYYNEIYPTLDGKKGTLYLDSGNHFQAF